MSRWISPWACAAASPDAVCMPIRTTSSISSGPVRSSRVLQRFAGDVLHDQVGQAVRLVDAVDGDDVVVADGGGGLRLAGEAPPGDGAAGHGGGQHLDRHQAVQRRIERLEDDAHAALADHLLHLVVAQHAQDARPVGRAQEVQVGRFLRRRSVAAFDLVQPLQDLRQGRVGGRDGRVADLPGQPQQGVPALLGPVEALLADRARLQVALVAVPAGPAAARRRSSACQHSISGQSSGADMVVPLGGRSGLLHGPDQFLQPGEDAAAGEVNGGDGQAEVGGHLLAGLAVDGGPPERLPGGVRDVPADLLAGPGEQPPLPLGLPLRLRLLGGRALLQEPVRRGVAAAARPGSPGPPASSTASAGRR